MTDKKFTDWLAEPGGGLYVTFTLPDPVVDANFHPCVYLRSLDDTSTTNPDFTTNCVLALAYTQPHGQNTRGEGVTVKTTANLLSITGDHIGSGQHIGFQQVMNGYGMGDFAGESRRLQYASGPIFGDEGSGWSSINYMIQLPFLDFTNVLTVPTPSAANTTTTQSITRSKDVQTITVASSAGISVGDWVVVNLEMPTGTPNTEAVQITAVGAGTISGKFRCNYASGVTIKGAMILIVDNTFRFGQDRVLINKSATPYTTGTVSTLHATSEFVGSGTTWTTAMLRYAIAVDNDDYTGSPFGVGAAKLRTWHQINARTDNTHINIHSFSVTGDTGYKGKVVTGSTYVIYPAVKILKVSGTMLICEPSNVAWSVGDVLEQAVCPYPDVQGFQYHMAHYTPNAGNLRGFMDVKNNGARAFDVGIMIRSEMKSSGGGDTIGWGVGYQAQGCAIGFQPTQCTTAAILLESFVNGSTDISGKISWNGPYIMPNSTNGGLELQTTTSGSGLSSGLLQAFSAAILSETNAKLVWPGSIAWGGYADITTMTAPAAPASGRGRLYVDLSGGKNRLMVRFPTGAVQQIAIEP
jgi:hypothetical protein